MSIKLFRAVLKGKYDEAKATIDRGRVDVNTLLSISTAKKPKPKRVDNRNNIRSYAGYSLLHMAILKGNVPFIEYLLEHGADPNIYTQGANIPDTPVLYYAVEINKAHILQLLIDAGADVNTRSGPYGYTAMNQAILFGNDAAIRILLNNGAHVRTMNSVSMAFANPMMFAETLHNKEAMKIIAAHTGPTRTRTRPRTRLSQWKNRSVTRKSQSDKKNSNRTIKHKRSRRLSSDSDTS